jgi:hypothetical protein
LFPFFAGAATVHNYGLYGVGVEADFPLFTDDAPETEPLHAGSEMVRLVELAESESLPTLGVLHPFYQAHGRSLSLSSDRPEESISTGQAWQLTVEHVVSFGFVSGDPTIYYRLHEQGTRALLVFWFVHTFLPMYLAVERGCDFIHASAVEVEGRPILFVAPSKGGKSTLGDYFLGQGHPMLADDKLGIFEKEGSFFTASSYPYHRPFRQFEVLGRPIEHFATGAKLIHAIYVLEQGDPASGTEISEVRGLRKFEQLMPHYLFQFPFLRAQRLGWMASLSSQCPVFRVCRPWNLDRMHEVHEAICAHSRELGLN